MHSLIGGKFFVAGLHQHGALLLGTSEGILHCLVMLSCEAASEFTHCLLVSTAKLCLVLLQRAAILLCLRSEGGDSSFMRNLQGREISLMSRFDFLEDNGLLLP